MNHLQLSENYKRDGFIRVQNLLGAAELAAVRDALDRYCAQVVPTLPESDRTFEADGVTLRNLWRMEQHDAFFRRLSEHHRILNLVGTLVNGQPVKGSHRNGVIDHRPSGVAGNSMGTSRMPDHEAFDEFCGTLDPGDAMIHHCQTIQWSAPTKPSGRAAACSWSIAALIHLTTRDSTQRMTRHGQERLDP